HLFVIEGRIGNLDCDAVVVPTDRDFVVEPAWHRGLGVRSDAVGGLEPSDWAQRRFGRGRSSELVQPAWFVDVVRGGGEVGSELTAVMDWLRGALEEIAAAGLEPGAGRAKVLVALPTVGTGGGGFDDVAAAARALAERARRGELALFVGAGVSMAAGLPSWEALITSIAERHGVDLTDVASPLDRAELLRREFGADFGAAVAQEASRVDRYAITHSLLAALGCSEVVTTNYDGLYELAADDVEGTGPLPVLPYDEPRSGRPWVLKMHGDVRDPA